MIPSRQLLRIFDFGRARSTTVAAAACLQVVRSGRLTFHTVRSAALVPWRADQALRSTQRTSAQQRVSEDRAIAHPVRCTSSRLEHTAEAHEAFESIGQQRTDAAVSTQSFDVCGCPPDRGTGRSIPSRCRLEEESKTNNSKTQPAAASASARSRRRALERRAPSAECQG